MTLRTRPCDDANVQVAVGHQLITLPAGTTRTVPLDHGSGASTHPRIAR